MNWVFLALLAPFVYAVNVFLDKYLVEARLPNYRALPIFGLLVAIPAVVVFWIISGFAILGLSDSLLIMTTGILTIWAFSLYLEALVKEETSLLIILIQLIPVIVLVMAYFILGETITLKQLLGFGLLLFSSIAASLKQEKKRFKFNRALIFMLLADLLWASTYILIKFVSVETTFSSLVMYESLGVIIGGILLLLFFPSIKNAFLKTIKKIKKPVLGLVLFNEGLYLSGKIITYLAITIGPPALISILGSTQIFFGILFGSILTLMLPKIFKEDLSRSGMLRKILLGVLAFIGIILVS